MIYIATSLSAIDDKDAGFYDHMGKLRFTKPQIPEHDTLLLNIKACLNLPAADKNGTMFSIRSL